MCINLALWLSWCLSRFSIQDEAMDIARPGPQGAHYHGDVIYLSLEWEIKMEWHSKLVIHQLDSLPNILYAPSCGRTFRLSALYA